MFYVVENVLGISQRNGNIFLRYLDKSVFQSKFIVLFLDLSNISRRIRDIIDYHKKRKWEKLAILTEQEYMLQLFGFYSLDYFRGGAQQNAKHNDK